MGLCYISAQQPSTWEWMGWETQKLLQPLRPSHPASPLSAHGRCKEDEVSALGRIRVWWEGEGRVGQEQSGSQKWARQRSQVPLGTKLSEETLPRLHTKQVR